MRLAPAFEQLLAGWKAQGWRLTSTRTLFESLQPFALPRCEVGPGPIEGRAGTLLVQRGEFLADADQAQDTPITNRQDGPKTPIGSLS